MPVETPAQYARQHPRATAVAGSSTAVASPTGPSNGSRTVTIEHDDDDDHAKDDALEAAGQGQRRVGVLRLRGRALPGGPRVQWQDDVVDNEMLNRKKSKICCIYHKPKEFDESSSDESGSESASSDGSNDSRVAKPSRQRPPRRHHHNDHGHDPDHGGCGLNQANTSASASSITVTAPIPAALNAESSHDTPEVRPAEPNAYERSPNRPDKGKGRA